MKIYPPEIEEIRAAWKASGLTQHQFAAKVGVRYGVMMNILAGTYFAEEHFNQVRAALNLAPATYRHGQEPVAPSAPVEPAKPVKPCAVCRTPTADFYRQHDAYLCSEVCVEIQREVLHPSKAAAPAKKEPSRDYKQFVLSCLVQAQQAVTDGRIELANVPASAAHERALTQALTLITGVRFALGQE